MPKPEAISVKRPMGMNSEVLSMTSRQWMALAGLTLSAFMLNTSEFMPIGLLTDIASGFGLSLIHI